MVKPKKLKCGNLQEGRPKETEDFYFEYKYLSSLRLVTRGISHNYNNIFSGFLGYLDTNRRADNLEQTKTLTELVERAIGETEILFGFARHSRDQRGVQSFSGIVESAASALRAVSPKYTIQVVCQNPFVKVDGCFSDLVLMLFYIGENAIEAMPGGGSVMFKITEQHDKNGALWLTLVVSDDGPGVAPAVRSNIFSPFVTTKEEGSHYGLGLPMAREIALSHGGVLSFSPKTSGGTDFILKLPAAMPRESKLETKERKTQRDDSIGQKKSRHVFFVIDDDSILLDYLVAGLQRKGHIVFSASSCYEALEDYKNVCEIVTIFVVDIGLSDLDGIECMKNLREINDTPGVIFMSGEAGNSRSRGVNQTAFLAKPFTIRQLEDLAENVTA